MALIERQITEIIADVVSNITWDSTLYFDFGNYIELSNKLNKKNRNNQKYPLFALVLDVTEREVEQWGVYKAYDFNLIIAYNTNQNYTSQQRRDNIFKLILQPLYRKLIDEIKLNRSRYFLIENDFIDHTKYDRYFLGTETENQNRFNDFVDAIEIEFRNIKITNKTIC